MIICFLWDSPLHLAQCSPVVYMNMYSDPSYHRLFVNICVPFCWVMLFLTPSAWLTPTQSLDNKLEPITQSWESLPWPPDQELALWYKCLCPISWHYYNAACFCDC
jgi:hypothetical protein